MSGTLEKIETVFSYTSPDGDYPGYVNMSIHQPSGDMIVAVRGVSNPDQSMEEEQWKTIPNSEIGKISDGYHTFEELYQHRCTLFACLMKSHPDLSWKSKKHSDGSAWDGWFIAGMRLPSGDITYHLPADMWELLSGVDTLDLGVAWDGHTSADVVARLTEFAKG